ncbi:MAG: hypothetical protein KGD63_01650 [Candidatus Lokiarchaeota archaeon]|nr:hypothetical protein [Candidatus Lokiarchaeota archaeon]
MIKITEKKFDRLIIVILLFCGFILGTFLPFTNILDQGYYPKTELKSAPDIDFVYTEGTEFMLNGLPFYFVGTNCYYLGYMSEFMVDNLFDDMVEMNLKVCRTWGYLDAGTLNPDGSLSDNVDGEGHKNGVYYHYWDPEANAPAINEGEDGLQNLDYVLYSASNHGIKLVIPFVNYWSDMGGMEQYCRWLGISDKEEFYTNPTIMQYYKDYISALLNRVNIYSGIQYKEDPTIFAWQLANEPRCPGDTSGDTIVNWASEISSYIKSIDSKHLVCIGDEGFYDDPNNNDYPYTDYEGGDWPREIEISTIDYGTVHLYPDHWGFAGDPSWGTQWIIDHASISQGANKPMVLGEFGWQDRSTRDAVYTDWFQAIEDYDVGGDTYWMLAGQIDDGSAYADYDGFTVYWDADLSTQSTALLIRDHAIRMEDKNIVIPDNESPATPTGLIANVINSFQIQLEWNENNEIDLANYNIYRSTISDFTPNNSNQIAESTENQYIDLGLNAETTYYYKVSAIDHSENESPVSNQVSATTPEEDLIPPATPTGLIATTLSSSRIELDWNDNTETDLAQYILYRSTISGFTPSSSNAVIEIKETQFIDIGLTQETTYYYKLVAFDTSNNPSNPSSEATATTEKILAELRAQYRCANGDPSTQDIRAQIQILNDGPLDVALTDVTVRYWFTSEPALNDLTYSCDYAAIGASGITSLFGDGGDSEYLEISFTSSATLPTWLGGDGSNNFLPVGANTGDIQNRIGRNSNVNFDQLNDYSFDASITDYTDNLYITVYYQSDLVWGLEPTIGPINDPPSINQPSDISITEGEPEIYISWTATDSDPAIYTISQDGSQVQIGSWTSGTAIMIQIGGTEGIYTYEIIVSDQVGQSVTDIVIVTIFSSGEFQNGDVNHDGEVDIVDALMIAQYYVGQDPQPFYEEEADVDDSGEIDIVDALLIAQTYVGLIELPP